MPVTHGVAGSSPVRTAEILERKFRDFLFSTALPHPSNIRFCGNRQKSAEQPSKQRDAPPGKSTTYGSRNPDSTDIGKVHNEDSLSANPGPRPGHNAGTTHTATRCRCMRMIQSSRRKTKVVFLLLSFSDLSHHRTCGSAYGGSYFWCHSRYVPIKVAYYDFLGI